MKKKLILLPIFALLLAGCGKTPSEDVSVPPSSEGGIEYPSSEEPITPSEKPSEPVVVEGVTSIVDAKKLAKDTIVTTAGYVTSVYVGSSNGNLSITIQDGDDALLLYGVDVAIAGDVKKGDSIEVTGAMGKYKVEQLVSITKIKTAATPIAAVEPLDITKDFDNNALKASSPLLVKVVDVPVKADTPLDIGSEDNFNDVIWATILKDEPATNFGIYTPRHVGYELAKSIADRYNDVNSEVDTVTLIGTVGEDNSGNAQMFLTELENFVVNKGEVVGDPVESVSLDVETLSLGLGGQHQLVPTVLPATAADKRVSYVSSALEVVSVNAVGVLRAYKAGEATVTVTTTDGEKTASVVVTVSETLDAKVIKPADARSHADKEFVNVYGVVTGEIRSSNGTYSIQYEDGAITTFTYGLVLPVNHEVVVFGQMDSYADAGYRQITNVSFVDLGVAKHEIVPLVVTDISTLSADLSGVLVTIEGLSYVSGEALEKNAATIKTSLNDVNLDIRVEKDFTAEQVAVVNTFFSELGNKDTFNITAPLGWFKGPQLAYTLMTILTKVDGSYVPATGVTVSSAGGVVEIEATRNIQLSAVVAPIDALQAVTWSSSNEDVATVDNNGLVTGVAAGSVTITATAPGGVSGSIELTIIAGRNYVNVNKSTVGVANNVAVENFELDENWALNGDSGTANNPPKFYNNGLRIYSVRETGLGNILTISPAEGNDENLLTKVSFTALDGLTAAIKIRVGNSLDEMVEVKAQEFNGLTYTYENLEGFRYFELTNVHTGGSKNLQIILSAIEIEYFIG